MIIEIEKLKKIDEIISCEGGILIVYKYMNQLYLSSQLSDGTGMIFYSTKKALILNYLLSKINLIDLYNLSNDIFVTRKFQRETSLFLSQDFSNLIEYGNLKFEKINKGLINHNFVNKILNDSWQ
jgi:hypothetical protein